MPNWTGNTVTIFVPKTMEAMVEQIIDALRGDAADGGINWFDLARILPVPTEYDQPFPEEIVKAVQGGGLMQLLPREVRDMLSDDAAAVLDQGGADRETRIAALPEDMMAEVERAGTVLEKHGALYVVDWQRDNWGVKYCECGDEPEVVEDPAQEYDEEDCIMIRWVFSTPWTWPKNAAIALAEVCRRYGLGMRWWFSESDGGSAWNPVLDEYQTIWEDGATEASSASVTSMAPASLTDAVMIVGRGFDPVFREECEEEREAA